METSVMKYADSIDALEELVQLGVLNIERKNTPADDEFTLTDFGKWLGDKQLFEAFNRHEELREKIRKIFHEIISEKSA